MVSNISRFFSVLLLIYCITIGFINNANGKEIISKSLNDAVEDTLLGVDRNDFLGTKRQVSEVSEESGNVFSDGHTDGSETSNHTTSTSHSNESGHEEEGHHGSHPYYAIIFPWFVVATGIFVYYIITRYCHFIPYTAILFLIGAVMGVAITVTDSNDQLTQSIRMWENINSELLLLAFLPGLLFKDAYGLDFHLFTKAFVQILIMAFPMVLAGTCLMALVGTYVLPYGWNFNLAMTFGAILSATDPVAVSALLNELGAPPRLKTHIAGESLLNDGSAMVFFKIFKTLYLFDIGIPGGKEIGLSEGILTFLNMSVGAALVGVAFGLGLLIILHLLNHRHNGEENTVQVSATIGAAYLSYYVAEVVCAQSGVLSVVFCGITTKAFASSIINDHLLMDKFWVLVEHLLNTVLFALGGVVWGTVISTRDTSRSKHYDGTDWGYLIVVYILMMVIRFLLFGLAFPIISRIGLKSKWKETVFQSFGGLRGAVGIALAISLENEVAQQTDEGDQRRVATNQLLGITGGIALLTLFINGILGGPLIKKLKLTRASKERQKIIVRYENSIRRRLLEKLVYLLGEERFECVEYESIQNHIFQLKDITGEELKMAVRTVKEVCPVHLYVEPNLSIFDNHIEDEELESIKKLAKPKLIDHFRSAVRRIKNMNCSVEIGLADDVMSATPKEEELIELRLVFIELLQQVYNDDLAKGEIDTRRGIAMYELQRGIATTKDDAHNGLPIKILENSQTRSRKVFAGIRSALANTMGRTAVNIDYCIKISSFIHAHKEAKEKFLRQFCHEIMTPAERKVLDEVDSQIKLADERMVYKLTDSNYAIGAKQAMSLLFLSMLLNDAALIVDQLVSNGLLKQAEGDHYLEEIDHKLENLTVKSCKIEKESKDSDIL